ncbi:hypothetical protein LRP67_06600 [Nocardioides sp. cx-169]|uniref:lipopolysaccharide biosynthesis protein n=1 Tax=Nocardioides sp. cx-169 TaxID=2899080 RepID=UPI001E293F0C|nr:hypothetical protein [Nocardioides sp. cx-169]MCD4533747.1 hypothetical protein [Nocardioides sp. cx-169]
MRFFPENAALGVWFTILTLVGWCLTLDLGLGNGLRNRLVETLALESVNESRTLISSTYVASGGIAACLGILLFPIVYFVDWNRAFNVEPEVLTASTLRTAVALCCGAIVLQLFLRLSTAVLLSRQRAVASALPGLGTSAGMLLTVLIVSPADIDTNFVILSAAYLFWSATPLLAAGLVAFSGDFKIYRPSVRFFSLGSLPAIFRVGFGFLGLQLLYMALITTDTPLVSWLFSPRFVVDYQAYFRPFGLVGSLFVVAMTPMWSRVTHAWVVGDTQWIERAYRRANIAALVGFAGCLAAVPVMPQLLDLWLGAETINVQGEYSLAFAVLTGATMMNSVMASFTSGLGEIRFQLLFYGVAACAKIPLALFLCRQLDSWIGIVWATAVGLLVYSASQAWWLAKKFEPFRDQSH